MEIKNIKLEDLKPYEKNPRKNDEAVKYVVNSIREFGFKVPIIIDKNNIIVAGHTRYKAAQKLGLKEVPCIIADDLTDEQIKAFRLADNKVAEQANWENGLLMKELDELFGKFDMSDFGFSVQIENLMEDVEEPEQVIASELDEANNYVVLEFKTKTDWEKAKDILELKEVYTDMPNPKMRGKGIGRVIDGKEVIERLEKENGEIKY